MNHTEKLDLLCKSIKDKVAKKAAVTFEKSSVSHFVPNPEDPRFNREKINIRDFCEILSIDTENNLCTAESGVTFEKLVTATLEYGLIPKCVPELRTITIGGAVSGCSVESMSYKFGGFHDSCVEYETVTSDGNIVICSEIENSDIFHLLHNSFGTLGVITSLKFKLIKAKPYVKMNYVVKNTIEEYRDFLAESMSSKEIDFIDGIIFGPNHFTACLGVMTDDAPYLSSYQGTEIFHRSVRTKDQDYLKIQDYFFRYDHDCHWLTETIPPLTLKPVRKLFGRWFLGSTNLIKWSKRLRHIMKLKRRPEVVVDVFIPGKNFVPFLEWYESDFSFYPLWVVPYRYPEVYPWINPQFAEGMGDDNLIIDFAVYGKKNNNPNLDYSKLLEDKVYELNGVKTLISRNHYSEKRFWEIYNEPAYNDVKRRMDPAGLFLDIYSKFNSQN